MDNNTIKRDLLEFALYAVALALFAGLLFLVSLAG